MAQQDALNPSHSAFDCFVQAQTCKDILQSFADLCHHLEVDPQDHQCFYSKLKERLNYWKAKALWTKLDKRAAHPDYGQGKACERNKCLVVGAGPCGLRTAVELALLGAQVVLLEKREAFSRNNVLHLWPFTIHDLRGLAAKKFYGRFCSGSLDHISIRQLQLILLKVALLLGVEVHVGVEYKGLLEPRVNGKEVTGWQAELHPENHRAKSFQFDVLISAGGGRFVPEGFRRKELRGKLAIGITANFINHRSAAEAQVAEISGVARIYNQKFFQDLHNKTGIDLENIVYYKDDTHYFVMTAKKTSLLNNGVIKQDHSDVEKLLSPANVDQDSLLRYALDAAQFSTGHCLPDLEFACNHGGRPDVAMFDFTCMYRAENASMVREKKGRKLLIGLVGDCLVEPFWPLGTGIARGFLAAFDAAWMVRCWGLGMAPQQVLAERESVYQLLSQTTPENTSKKYGVYSINPTTRYPNINLTSIKPNQVCHLYSTEDHTDLHKSMKKKKDRASCLRQDSVGSCEVLLSWCQQNTTDYKQVTVTDLTKSWRSGLALCALIHHFRPNLLDFSSLDESDPMRNNQLAFNLAEKELGIPPVMSASDMLAHGQPDKLSMVLYLTQFYNTFTGRVTSADQEEVPASKKSLSLPSTQSVVLFLTKLKYGSLQRRKEKLSAEQGSRQQKMGGEEEDSAASPLPSPTLLLGSSESCYFCSQRVYILERVSAEGKFFHRSCFTCHQCGSTLRLGSYSFDQATGKFYCVQHSEESPVKKGEKNTALPQFKSTDKDGPEQHNSTVLGPLKRNGKNEQSQPSAKLAEEEQTAGPLIPEHKELPSGITAEGKDFEEHHVSTPEEQPRESATQCLIDVCADPEAEHRPYELAESGQESIEGAGSSVVSPDQLRKDLSQEKHPVPAPRAVYQVKVHADCSSHDGVIGILPVPKPRSVVSKPTTSPLLVSPESPALPKQQKENEEEEMGDLEDTSTDSRPKQPLRKLQLTEEERSRLASFSFGQDSDSEAPSPAPEKPPRTLLEPDKWTQADGQTGSYREQKNRRSFRRKEELVAKAQAQAQAHNPKARSKFSPWNLSSPRLAREHRFSAAMGHVLTSGEMSQPDIKVSDVDGNEEGDEGDDDDDDDDDDDKNPISVDDAVDLFDAEQVPSDPVEAKKMELLRMKTLERHAKLCELQRFHKAQSIQRRLEEIEVTFKELEEKGVVLERALRGEAATGSGTSSDMIDQWIQLVHEKNAVVSEESDLMVASRQLELEDKQSILESELRRYVEMDDSEKTAEQQAEEERLLQEILVVVDMRNSLVAFLEEQRLKEMNEQLHGMSIVEPKRPGAEPAQVHWA